MAEDKSLPPPKVYAPGLLVPHLLTFFLISFNDASVTYNKIYPLLQNSCEGVHAQLCLTL